MKVEENHQLQKKKIEENHMKVVNYSYNYYVEIIYALVLFFHNTENHVWSMFELLQHKCT